MSKLLPSLVLGTALSLSTTVVSFAQFESNASSSLLTTADVTTSNSYLSVDTLADLKVLPSRPRVVVVRDYAEPNDGGGGFFSWIPNDVSPANDCLVVMPSVGQLGRFKRIVGGVIDVRTCGARPSAADNAAAFQAALDAGLMLKKAVYVPGGTYAVGKTLVAGHGIELIGNGWQSVIRAKSGSNVSAVLLIGSDAGVSSAQIRDLQIDCNKADNPTSGDGIRIVRGYKANLHNVRVAFCKAHGVSYRAPGSSFENYVYNTSLYSNDGFGLFMQGIITDTHVIGGDIGFNAAGGVQLATSSSINGATIWGGGQVNSTGVVVAGISSQIIGNRIEGHGRHGISVGANDYIYIANNKIYANAFNAVTSGKYDGIFVDVGADFGTITGNKIYSSVVQSSPYSMRYAVNFAGAHKQWTIAGNDMGLLTAAGPASLKMSGSIVRGVLETDRTDFNWISTQVRSHVSGDVRLKTAGAWIAVPFDADDVDVLSEFANGAFVPKNTGRYRIEVMVSLKSSTPDQSATLALKSSTGAELRRINFQRADSAGMIYLHGSVEEYLSEGETYILGLFVGSDTTTINGSGKSSYLSIRAVPN